MFTINWLFVTPKILYSYCIYGVTDCCAKFSRYQILWNSKAFTKRLILSYLEMEEYLNAERFIANGFLSEP